jgi:hypothetical protein
MKKLYDNSRKLRDEGPQSRGDQQPDEGHQQGI